MSRDPPRSQRDWKQCVLAVSFSLSCFWKYSLGLPGECYYLKSSNPLSCCLKKLPYRKIPKISPGGYIFIRPLLRGLFLEGLIYEGKFMFKIDWASLIVGSKFTVFPLFYLIFEGNFPSTSPRGAYIWRSDLTEGFLRYRFGGLIFEGAYFRKLTVTLRRFHWFPREMTFEKTLSSNRSSVWNSCAPSSDILSWGNQL